MFYILYIHLISKRKRPDQTARMRRLIWGFAVHIQLTLIISKSKGLSEILRDIHISTYQIYRNEEKITTPLHEWICSLTPEIRDILKILWKRREIAPKNIVEKRRNCSSFPQYLVTLLDSHVKTGTRFSLRGKRFSEISEVDITRVVCMYPPYGFPGTVKIVLCYSWYARVQR